MIACAHAARTNDLLSVKHVSYLNEVTIAVRIHRPKENAQLLGHVSKKNVEGETTSTVQRASSGQSQQQALDNMRTPVSV